MSTRKIAHNRSEQDEWVTLEEFVDDLVEPFEKDENVGGTIPEAGHGHKRVILIFNNPRPSGSGHAVIAAGATVHNVWRMLAGKNWTG